MKFIGLRKDEEGNIVEYELKLYRKDITCLYQDRNGIYVCTQQGKMYKVNHDMPFVKEQVFE
jgi:hypothetical protein